MSREETMDTVCGEMMDLLACIAISNGAEQKEEKKILSFDEAIALR